MNCKCCNSESTQIHFEAKILNKYQAPYLLCNKCGFLFAKDPFWLEESYNSAITNADTGILIRNEYFKKYLTILIRLLFRKESSFIDYAGGYGLLTRMMRDIGFNYFWTDKYCENLFAKSFEYHSDIQNIAFLSAFEVFEHLENPSEEIDKMLAISDTIIFSTELLPNPIPAKDEWWYYAFSHGQHIAFYTKKSLQILAKRKNLHYSSVKNMHIISKKKHSSLILKFIKYSSYTPLFHIFKIGLKSKTYSDHQKLI
jgi:hypothetical protein